MTTLTPSQRIIADAMSEADLLRAIIDAARTCGYLVHHCRPAQSQSGRWSTPIQGDAGFPDVILVPGRPGLAQNQILAWELKREGKYPTAAQIAWLEALGAIPGVSARVVRPRDWVSGWVERELMATE